MPKMVIVVEGEAAETDRVARDLSEIPGVSVTGQSEGFVDVEATAQGALTKLREFTSGSGLSLHPLTESSLIEPIPTSKIK